MTGTHKKVDRRTPAGDVVRVDSAGVSIREFGRRTWYGPVSFGAIKSLAAKQLVASREAEKKTKRKKGVRRSVI